MLDGIDYYPSKRQKKPRKKLWVLSFIVLLLGGYGVSQFLEKTIKKPIKNTLIVVSKGEKQVDDVVNSIIIKSNKNYQPKIDYRVKSDKGLDELIQTFEQ